MLAHAAPAAGLALALTGAPCLAADKGLFEFCPLETERMDLVVERLGKAREAGGLTQDRIRNAVESRLRGAQVFSDSRVAAYLYVNVNTGKPRKGGQHYPYYSIDLAYKRVLADPETGERGFATTWNRGGTGQGDAPWIIDSLHELVDEFLVAYLRVRDAPRCARLRNIHADLVANTEGSGS